jgi:hypothetical protein
MRRSLTLCRDGLAAAAALVLLTACSGSDDEGDSSTAPESSTATTSQSPSESEQPAASEFCADAAAIQERVASSFGGQADLSNLDEVFAQTAEDIRELEPPAELAADWVAFADGLDEIAAISQIDFNDQAAVAQWQQQVAALQGEYGPAFTNVDAYLSAECGFDTDPTDPASPTS